MNAFRNNRIKSKEIYRKVMTKHTVVQERRKQKVLGSKKVHGHKKCIRIERKKETETETKTEIETETGREKFELVLNETRGRARMCYHVLLLSAQNRLSTTM